MRYNSDHSARRSANGKLRVLPLLVQGVVLSVLLLSCRRTPGPAGPRPPDLSRCTRLEIQYYPSTIDYFIPEKGLQESILSSGEKAYLESLKTLVATDPRRIRAFARQIRLGSYVEDQGRTAVAFTTDVVCHQNGERLTSFTILCDLIRTEDGHWFEYPREGEDLRKSLHALTPQIRPFQLRSMCAGSLNGLWLYFRLFVNDKGTYPAPSQWCDAIARVFRTVPWSTGHVGERFKCPSAGRGKSHYAMNPHCEPNSPPDTVFLFESKAGWNQHGGPELFAFDNHEPRGGNVELKDGTVKFIRTEEELQQLRWK